jgi:two-component system response regulator ChvI
MPQAQGAIVALVEDEKNIRETVAYSLRKEGYRVLAYRDGEEAWQAFERSLPDLVILDILLPRLDGLELCRRIRARSRSVPLIFLTSKDEEFDRVLGLELGADDYLCKPFSMRELAARVRVLFRRLGPHAPPAEEPDQVLHRGPLELDGRRHTALWQAQGLALTVTEFRILQALAREPGVVKTRAQLLTAGFPHDQYMSDRTVDTHIKRLRRKLTDADPGFTGIETIHGLGYRFNLDSPA